MRVYTIIAIIFLTAGLPTFAGKAKIEGEFLHTGDHKEVVLYEMFGVVPEKYSTTSLNDGVFSFIFKDPLPRGFYKVGVTPEKSVDFVWEGDEQITITADLNKPQETAKVEGGKGTPIFDKFNELAAKVSLAEQQRNQIIQLSTKEPDKYSESLTEANQVLNNARVEQMNFYQNTQKKHADLFITKIISLNMLSGELTKENYFDGIDFKDDELARSTILVARLNHYFTNYVPKNLQAWKQEATYLLDEKIPEGVKSREMVFLFLTESFMRNNDLGFAKKLATRYAEEYPDSKYAKEMLANIPDVPIVGEIVPDISLSTPDGEELALSSLRGKIVLIDFWASWCGPCRHENPNVVRVYNKYKDQGFTVYSVSLDKSKNSWVNAIKADGLIWPNHVSDLQHWKSEAAKTYQVRGIPATFLIDRDGRLVAQNLRGPSLELKLQEMLAREPKE